MSKIDEFDAGFFNISPREAVSLDPQQRLLLETAWEGLEDAGVDVARLPKSTGVFIGQWSNDFEALVSTDPRKIDFYAVQGSGRYASSGRLSYVFGLNGPSITLDTACSSSLVAVHLATRSIRSGECDVALVGAVNLILQPLVSIGYSQSRMMAEDGRCKFGDAAADGYVRGEGAAVIVLKSLRLAQQDGDRVYAVIRGSAVTNDGNSSGSMGRPSAEGQELTLRAAYNDAGIDPSRVGYIEAHGPGTRAGDPVELKALAAVLGSKRNPTEPLYVGSVKTNLGHTEAVAGLAGLIKTCLVLYNGSIPPSLNIQNPSPLVPWDQTGLTIPRAAVPWPRGSKGRFAGVTAFGIAGTNAHIVLEEPTVAPVQPRTSSAGRAFILPLSAKAPQALQQLASRVAEQIEADPQLDLNDLCWSFAARRTALNYRSATVAGGRAAMVEELRLLAESGSRSREIYDADFRKICFVCPGQGAQWPGMAQELIRSDKTFLAAMEECDAAARQHIDFSLIDQIMAEPDNGVSRLDEIGVVQPLLVALAVAYARALANVGIVPDVLVGHSMGEVAAAVIAGVLDIKQAMRIICRRSALMQRCRGLGGMALVDLSIDETAARLAGLEDRLGVAVSNSPRSCVISGDLIALKEVLGEFERDGIFARAVNVDVASHSPQMDGAAAELSSELFDLTPRGERIPIWSTVHGRRARGEDFVGEYWGRNLRHPVRFLNALEGLLAEGFSTFVELGPHPVLLHAIEQTAHLTNRSVTTVACGRREEHDNAAFFGALGTLWSAGHALPWDKLVSGSFVPMPAYPWQRERYWPDYAKLYLTAGKTELIPTIDDGARDWIHTLEWRESKSSALQSTGHGQRCLFVGDDPEINAAFARASEVAGINITFALWSELDRELSVHAHTGEKLNLILNLPDNEFAGYAPIHALQSVLRQNWRTPPKFWVLTRGAQAVCVGARISVDQAAAWGTCRVIAREHPELQPGLIDLDDQHLSSSAAVLALDHILMADLEDQIAFRGDRRFVLRLKSCPPDSDLPFVKWRSDGAYLITGGFGAIGLGLARSLAKSGVRRLILMGRTPLPPRDEWSRVELGTPIGDRVAAVRALEAQGVSVHVAPVDVADEHALREFFRRYQAEAWPPVRGVIHAAAILDNGLASSMTPAVFDSVIRTKLRSAQTLEEVLPDLDVFVLMSSMRGFMPEPGEANYAAANAGLDALAQNCRARGLPAISIAWGIWEKTGLADRFISAKSIAEFASQGIGTIEPDRGIALFLAICGHPLPNLAVVPFDWGSFRRAGTYRDKPVVSGLLGSGSFEAKPKRFSSDTKSVGVGVPDLVKNAVSAVLKIPPSRIDSRKPLGAMGLTSLMAIDLRNLLEIGLERPLPATIAWNYPTIEALIAYLGKVADDKPGFDAVAMPAPPILANNNIGALTDYSEEEALALLRDIREPLE